MRKGSVSRDRIPRRVFMSHEAYCLHYHVIQYHQIMGAGLLKTCNWWIPSPVRHPSQTPAPLGRKSEVSRNPNKRLNLLSFPPNWFCKSFNTFLFTFGPDWTCSPLSSLPHLFIRSMSLSLPLRWCVHPGMDQQLRRSTSASLSTQRSSTSSYCALYARIPPYGA